MMATAMKRTRWALIFGVMLFLVSLAASNYAFATDDERSRKTLKGISALTVVVEHVANDIDPSGTLISQIQTDVELKLRLAGIMVNQESEQFLYVDANIVRIESGRYIFNCILELNQGVTLKRNNTFCFACTWSANCAGITNSLEKIRDSVKDLVDIFINAYLSVNPKK